MEASGSADVSPIIIVTRADLDAGNAQATSDSSASVHSSADLSGFIAANIQADSSLGEVKSSSDSVSVTYKQHAKLFGFVPMMIDATATISADGSVQISYPWYAFVFVKGSGSLESKIKGVAMVDLGSNASAAVAANGKLSAATQAKLISDIRAMMWSELNADASASASASGSASVQ